jgi:hypothetical protein
MDCSAGAAIAAQGAPLREEFSGKIIKFPWTANI